MANLVRIKEVYLYVGFTDTAAFCYEVKKLLDDNGIKYILLAYTDDSAHAGVFGALNSWAWGREARNEVFTNFPIVTWKECFDDFESSVECATTKEQVESKLLSNKNLIA